MSTNAIANCIRGHSSLSSETHQSLRMDMQKSSSCFCIHKRLKIPAGCDYASGLLLLKFHKAGPTKKWEWIEMEMAKGGVGQGKGVRPVDQRSAGPAARHLLGAVAVTLVVAPPAA
jgi:hypothetical protein